MRRVIIGAGLAALAVGIAALLWNVKRDADREASRQRIDFALREAATFLVERCPRLPTPRERAGNPDFDQTRQATWLRFACQSAEHAITASAASAYHQAGIATCRMISQGGPKVSYMDPRFCCEAITDQFYAREICSRVLCDQWASEIDQPEDCF